MTTFDLVPLDRLRSGVVLNDLDENVHLPYELGGWMLARASEREIAHFRDTVVAYMTLPGLRVPNQEMLITGSEESGSRFTHMQDLRMWRYTVLRPGPTPDVNGAQLAEALRISPADIWVELWLVEKRPGSDGPDWTVGGSPGRCVQYFSRMRPNEMPERPDLSCVAEVVNLRRDLDEQRYPEILRTLQLFRELDAVPETSSTKLLGYFGVIEGLLSHAPAPQDPVDSITRQLRRNLKLLSNRMPPGGGLDLDKFRNTKGSDEIVTKLYSYRSAIAHGGSGDQQAAWLEQHRPDEWSLWPTTTWLHWYMRRVVQRVLVAALREPQLISDLKGS